MKHSCYEILGVDDDASPAEIEAAYSARRDQLICISGEDAAKAQLTNLRECFAVLSDVNKRRRYDDQIAIPAPIASAPKKRPAPQTSTGKSALELLAIIGGVIIGIVVLGLVLSYKAPPAKQLVVEYLVDGTAAAASVTYTNASGGTEQHDVALPWNMKMQARKGDIVYISAQNKTDSGYLVVKILLNGVPIKSSTSSAEYGIADVGSQI